jgi:serine/threonine protein kinase
MPATAFRWLTDRLLLQDEIGSGGAAVVHFGRLFGPGGFVRTVAIKRLHDQYVGDPEFARMMLDEARLAARIQHPNVVATLDVLATDGELFIVLEHIHGETLARLMRRAQERGAPVPQSVAAGIMVGVLHGIHAAHEVTTDSGEPMGLVHRDISPQNILVGADGVARVLDFGIAKAVGRVSRTSQGRIKGKVAYMAPEQVRGEAVDRRADVFGAAVVLWELLTNERLFAGENSAESIARVLAGKVRRPSEIAPSIPPAIDDIVLSGLAPRRDGRFPSAFAMATAIEGVVPPATPRIIAEWVTSLADEALRERKERALRLSSIPIHDQGTGGSLVGPATDESEAPTIQEQRSKDPQEASLLGNSWVSRPNAKDRGGPSRVGALLLSALIVLAIGIGGATWWQHRGTSSTPTPATSTVVAAPPDTAATPTPSPVAPPESEPAAPVPSSSAPVVVRGASPPMKRSVVPRAKPARPDAGPLVDPKAERF